MKIPSSIQRWGLLQIFALSSFITIITISVVSGYIFFSFLRTNLLEHEISISSEFIQSVSLVNNPEGYFLGDSENGNKKDLEEYFQHIIGMPDVIGATAYNADLKIIWSSNSDLTGKTFTDNDELKMALTGIRLFNEGHTKNHSKQEHDSMPEYVDNFIESYIPVWDTRLENVIGVVEIYKSPRGLYKTINEGRVLVIIVSLFGGIILYWILYWIVRTAHTIIESQRERIKQATSRAVELNELHLRRIGSDLHDGPAQSLGYALLRLDSINDTSENEPDRTNTETFNKIQVALKDALQEIRDLSSGLVIPDLRDLSFKDALINLIKKHEKRTSTQVELSLGHIPDYVKISTKICIYRLVQEGLNNAAKYGRGMQQRAELTQVGTNLELVISDAGPGMSPKDLEKVNTGSQLGIRGMRERVESLGGSFHIYSENGTPGVRLQATLPISD